MTEITVRDLASHLLDLIETGNGDKKVRVSVTYDNCEHIQDLQGVHCFDEINWITLMGGEQRMTENKRLCKYCKHLLINLQGTTQTCTFLGILVHMEKECCADFEFSEKRYKRIIEYEKELQE